MKKLLIGLLFFASVFSLAACEDDKIETPETPIDPLLQDDGSYNSPSYEGTDLTDYEVVKSFIDTFSKKDFSALSEDLELPTTISSKENDGTITWTSSKTASLSNSGVVKLGLVDVNLTLSCFIEIGETKHLEVYNVIVRQLTAKEKLQQAVDAFKLIDNDEVFRDILILPRVTDDYKVYIDWSSSNDKVIDVDGNVTQTDAEQKVNLTAKFSYIDTDGTVLATQSKVIAVTVAAAKTTQYDTIDLKDDRVSNTLEVTSTADLKEAITNASAGDMIILKNGNTFDALESVTAGEHGTEENPIFIVGESFGENNSPKITGSTQLNINKNHWIIANLEFSNGIASSSTGVLNITGSNCRLTNVLIENFDVGSIEARWITIGGQYNEVDNCTFTGKATSNPLLTITRSNSTAQYHHIHNNHFDDFQEGAGSNGYETIRIGTSDQSQSDSHVLVENNYFTGCSGEIEIISIKSGRVIVRNNTVVGSAGLFAARHGKNCLFEGNQFFGDNVAGTGGIRMYDGGHIVRNNYIEGVLGNTSSRAGIVLHTGVNEVGTATVNNLQWTPFNLLIENNTLVNCFQGIYFDVQYNYGTEDTQIINNFVYSETTSALIVKLEHNGAVFTGNEFYATSVCDVTSSFTNLVGNQYKGLSTAFNGNVIEGAAAIYSQKSGIYSTHDIDQNEIGATWLRT